MNRNLFILRECSNFRFPWSTLVRLSPQNRTSRPWLIPSRHRRLLGGSSTWLCPLFSNLSLGTTKLASITTSISLWVSTSSTPSRLDSSAWWCQDATWATNLEIPYVLATNPRKRSCLIACLATSTAWRLLKFFYKDWSSLQNRVWAKLNFATLPMSWINPQV